MPFNKAITFLTGTHIGLFTCCLCYFQLNIIGLLQKYKGRNGINKQLKELNMLITQYEISAAIRASQSNQNEKFEWHKIMTVVVFVSVKPITPQSDSKEPVTMMTDSCCLCWRWKGALRHIADTTADSQQSAPALEEIALHTSR